FIRKTQQEVGAVIARTAAAWHPEEELAVDVKVVDRIVLVGRIEAPKSPGVPALGPTQSVGPDIAIVNQVGGSLRAEADRQAAGEAHDGRPSRAVGRNADAELGRRGSLDGRRRLHAIVPLRRETKFVEQCWGKHSGVGDVAEVAVAVAGG